MFEQIIIYSHEIFTVSFGGVFGLCFGASLLSLVEILYLFLRTLLFGLNLLMENTIMQPIKGTFARGKRVAITVQKKLLKLHKPRIANTTTLNQESEAWMKQARSIENEDAVGDANTMYANQRYASYMIISYVFLNVILLFYIVLLLNYQNFIYELKK